MRPYEVMVIFDAGTEPPAIQAVVDRLLETIRSNGGTPGHVDRWGRRPFAYEVKHRREGYYVLVELSGEARTVSEVDRFLSLADEVLRFKVIRVPDRVAARLAAGGSSTRPGGRGLPGRGHDGPGARGPRGSREGVGRSPQDGGSGAREDGGRVAEAGTAGS